MSPALMILAADLLEKAAKQFSRHGCSDYYLPKDMPSADVEALALLANRANYGGTIPATANPDDLQTAEQLRAHADDWILMGALAFGLKESAKEIRQ